MSAPDTFADGFEVPLHRSLTEPILLGGAPRTVAIANGTRFGLAAGVWTESLRRAVALSKRLAAGTVWVNTYRSTSYTTPFGGYKASGLGRENGIAAIREYLQTKSVWFHTGGSPANPYIRR